MVDRHYQQELAHLRELAKEFSKAHPALAPMLGGPSQDPDVERLLEGTAFLTGLLRHKLEDELPEVVHGLTRLIFPHYLRPIPSTTVVQFTPQPGLTETLSIPKNTSLASIPVEGTQCIFRTCFQVDLEPLSLTQATLVEQPGQPGLLKLRFVLEGLQLDQWQPKNLRLYFAGPVAEAASIWSLFFRQVSRIHLSPVGPGGSKMVLEANAIKQVGLDQAECLFPYPSHSFPGYRLIQEYFILPEKFLFADILGIDRWQDRGDGSQFEMAFELNQVPRDLPSIKKERFVLFAAPAINLFPHEADPILLDHRRPEYHLYPAGNNQDHFQVYSVEGVTGFTAGNIQKRRYTPFELFAPKNESQPIYSVRTKASTTRTGVDTLLSVAYPPGEGLPIKETLSIELMCTNASLPESLQLGDICRPTATSPNLCDFKNIRSPTSPLQPPLGGNLLWQFLSHLSLNFLSLAHPETLKTLLRLYIFPEGRDRAEILANERRIDGILGLCTQVVDRLVLGMVMRGQEIVLELNPRHFASFGDMQLFGMIMDAFLGSYASLNHFTMLKLKDSVTGEVFEWPARIGDRPLI